VLNKNNEAWSSFFSLLKLRKEGKLPPHARRVGPPRYWKDRGSKERKLILVFRQDRYIVDEQNRRLFLRDFDMEIEFAGRLRWHGKQGRLEIRHDGARGPGTPPYQSRSGLRPRGMAIGRSTWSAARGGRSGSRGRGAMGPRGWT